MAPDGNAPAVQDNSEPVLSPPVSGGPTKIIRQYELVDRVQAYAPQAAEDQLNAAYVYAMM